VTTIELQPTGDAVVRDLPHDQYLAHPALSASGAKTLVRSGGPARFRHERDNPRPRTDAMELGTAAHAAVLGTGPTIAVVDADSWRTKAAQQQRDQARAEGLVPMLFADARKVADMAAALRAHPYASRLLQPDTGAPEVSLFYRDPQYGVDRRCRVDFLRDPDPDGRLLLVDYKTTKSADLRSIDNAIADYGYHLSGAWYRDIIVGLGLARSVPVVLIFQETSTPYLVHVVELDGPWLRIGEDLSRRAMRIFAECTASGDWPGYQDITLSTPPAWLLNRHDDEAYGDD
jgi:PDDEXK-like domain of unknown function (DUF3799)